MAPLDVDALAGDVPGPDATAIEAAWERQRKLTKPAGSLGRLEELSVWIAGVQGSCPPRPFRRIRVVVFAGDHGVAKGGVSAYPPEVTAQMVRNFLAGGAAVNALARLVGAGVRIVDMAVDGETPGTGDETARHKVRRSSGRINLEDALTEAEAEQSFGAGMGVADEEVDAGADLLVGGDMGIGNTTAAATLVAAITGAEPMTVVGRGTGIDDPTWMRKAAAVRDALRRARPLADDPLGLLRTAGGADFAAHTGFLLQAARRRTPVVLDGVVSAACALLAARLAPAAGHWWVAGSRSPEPAQALALDRLGLTPLLDLGLRLGEGTGALLAVPLLVAAGATLREMATFEEAGVSGPGHRDSHA
jgi:nicotinate-nucleotide--dimethylbenzimidazole phosphoribosyltransferase